MGDKLETRERKWRTIDFLANLKMYVPFPHRLLRINIIGVVQAKSSQYVPS